MGPVKGDDWMKDVMKRVAGGVVVGVVAAIVLAWAVTVMDSASDVASIDRAGTIDVEQAVRSARAGRAGEAGYPWGDMLGAVSSAETDSEMFESDVSAIVQPEAEHAEAWRAIEYVKFREIVSESSTEPDAQGYFARVRVVESDAVPKYPLLRIEDRMRRLPDGTDELISHVSMAADHVIIRLRPGKSREDLEGLNAKHGVKILKKMFAPNMYLVQFGEGGEDTVRRLERLYESEDAVIANADPDYIVHALQTFPNDTRFDELYGMHNTGQTGGTDDADIDAPEAWDVTTGSRDVLVGVIDTGVEYTHQDIAANYWSNPGETGTDGSGNDKRTNGVDDDGNGFVDDWRGWDFINDDNDPIDDHYHGSHCSGTIGGVGNNSEGVAGVNWQVSIVGIKFLSSGGSGSLADGIDSIYYGTLIGCDLTSNSWGGGGFMQDMEDAINDAGAHDILFVAAAGNNSSDIDASPFYPASYECDNLISVAAV
ncbi:S8 family serine peptidase, partial [Planctomycetota bacterium]